MGFNLAFKELNISLLSLATSTTTQGK